MAGRTMNPDPRALRELQQAARQASDTQLIRLANTLDALPQRAMAEGVLDAVRPRLRHIRPARPLSIPRLLFLTLDPLLVAPRDWRPGQGTVPRSAIMPMAEHLREAEPVLVAAIEMRMTGAKLTDEVLAAEQGSLLWPAALRMLPRQPPAGWVDAGLQTQSFHEIAMICATLWQHSEALWRLRMAGRDGPPEAAVRPIFRTIAAEGPEAVELCMCALLPFATQPARVVAVVAGLSQALGPPAERALDRYLAGVEPGLEGADLESTASAASRFSRLLVDLDSSLTRDKPKRAQHLQALRMSAAQSCVQRLEQETATRLTTPLAAALTLPEINDLMVKDLESAVRSLRGIGESTRRLHASGAAERVLAPVIAHLTVLAGTQSESGPGFVRADALRLLEILAGSAVAARAQGTRSRPGMSKRG